MFTHKSGIVEMATSLLHNPPAMFIVGLITLAVGLAMVLVHNIWSGVALPIVVTLVGWLTLIKGLLFLFLSPAAVAGFFLGGLHYEKLFYMYCTICLLLGAYLTYGGFGSTSCCCQASAPATGKK
jgi:vacuolar-type H+-ATPase subunit I/STV1